MEPLSPALRGGGPPGEHQELEGITPAAECLLTELIEGERRSSGPFPLPYVVHAVASRAALLGRSSGSEIPPPALAPLLAQTYGLTGRERDVMRRMLQEPSTWGLRALLAHRSLSPAQAPKGTALVHRDVV